MVPVKVRIGALGVSPIGIPLGLCNLANVYFNGDKEWL